MYTVYRLYNDSQGLLSRGYLDVSSDTSIFDIYTISTEILQRSEGMGGGVRTGKYSCICWFVYATCGVGKL